jgi:hypothetical protein
MEQILEAVEAINADYARHSQAASEIAREWFDYRVVLPAMLDRLEASDLKVPRSAAASPQPRAGFSHTETSARLS